MGTLLIINLVLTYIYVRRPGNSLFEPWLVIAPSAVMNRVGRRGMGMYAGMRFKDGDIVGRYEGNVVGTYASKDTAINSNTVKRLVRGGADKLRIMRSPEEGWDVVDGDSAPLPTLSLVNELLKAPVGEKPFEGKKGRKVKLWSTRINILCP